MCGIHRNLSKSPRYRTAWRFGHEDLVKTNFFVTHRQRFLSTTFEKKNVNFLINSRDIAA
jgi:hypothetical protein